MLQNIRTSCIYWIQISCLKTFHELLWTDQLILRVHVSIECSNQSESDWLSATIDSTASLASGLHNNYYSWLTPVSLFMYLITGKCHLKHDAVTSQCICSIQALFVTAHTHARAGQICFDVPGDLVYREYLARDGFGNSVLGVHTTVWNVAELKWEHRCAVPFCSLQYNQDQRKCIRYYVLHW